jgi:hypothetical protein
MLRRFIPIMMILIIFLAFVLPTLAQDATAEPTPQAVIIDYPADGTLPVATAEPTQTETRSLFNTATLGELLLFLGLSAFAGGGIVAILLNFLGKKEVRDRVEDARNSWSPEQQDLLAKFTEMFAQTTGGILDFLVAVQDGKPNEPLAQLSAIEGPALARQSDVEELARKLDVLKRHYPIPQELGLTIEKAAEQ